MMPLIIERLRDWSYGAFLNETDSSCIAVGMTEEEARTKGEAALRRQRYFGDILVDIRRDDTARPCAEAFGRWKWGKYFIAVGRAEWLQYSYGVMLTASFAIWKEETSGEK